MHFLTSSQIWQVPYLTLLVVSIVWETEADDDNLQMENDGIAVEVLASAWRRFIGSVLSPQRSVKMLKKSTSDTHGKWLSESKKKKFRPKAAIWDRTKQSSICGLVCEVAAHKHRNSHGFFQPTFRETCFKIVSLLSDVRHLGMIFNCLGIASVKHEWHACSPKLVHFIQIWKFRVHGGIWWPLLSLVPPARCHRDPSYSRGPRQFLCCLHACIFSLPHRSGKYLTWPY